MKTIVLTTETTHHAYFIRELQKSFSVDCAVVESKSVRPQFPVEHDFEALRETHELEKWFNGKQAKISGFCAVEKFEDVNLPECSEFLLKRCPDLMIVFGTGRIRQSMIRQFPGRIINLHGGDPEKYRGLDTHLWAVYHRDFESLVTTLHMVNEGLDCGDIVLREKIKINPNMKLFELRRANTELCIELCRKALESFKIKRHFDPVPQKTIGRYYSFMPAVLKDICVKRFESYTAKELCHTPDA